VGRTVEFADVVAAIEQFGPLATLVTVSEGGGAHVGTVLVAIADDDLHIEVGARTRENLHSRPAVSLVWLDPDRDYQLILDGSAQLNGAPSADGLSAVTICVESGILHRLAGRPDAGSSCLTLAQHLQA
jgi:hypothetical protein